MKASFWTVHYLNICQITLPQNNTHEVKLKVRLGFTLAVFMFADMHAKHF